MWHRYYTSHERRTKLISLKLVTKNKDYRITQFENVSLTSVLNMSSNLLQTRLIFSGKNTKKENMEVRRMILGDENLRGVMLAPLLFFLLNFLFQNPFVFVDH